MTTRDTLPSAAQCLSSSLAAATALVALLCLPSNLCCTAQAREAMKIAQPARPSATVTAIEAWRKAVATLPPGKSGCFEATYPSHTLVARDCGKPEPLVFPRTPSPQEQPLDEHTSGDYVLISPGSITTATGSMQKMERVALLGEIDKNGKLLNQTNSASFQLNTNSNIPKTAARSKCAGSSNSACHGWLQFEFFLDPTQGPIAQIQEWIFNYGSGCPSGFSAAAGACVDNIAAGKIPGPLAAANLGGLVMSGQVASNGQTTMAIFVPGRNLVYTITGTDEVGAYGHWNDAEFNIFGEDSLDELLFEQGSLMAVNLTANSGVKATPVSCSAPSILTGESTNVTLGPCATTSASTIAFVEGVPPVVASISPKSGPAFGGTEVQIGGTGFQPSSPIQFNGKRGVQAYCPTTYNCGVYSPNGFGKVNVTAANLFADGTPGPFGQAFASNEFNYIDTPDCTPKQTCTFYENQPPTYTITCPVQADFYSWSGTPVTPTQPPPGNLLGKDVYTNSGSTTSEAVLVAACTPGTTNKCSSYPITYANLCYSRGGGGGGGGGLTCSNCSGGKCCRNPDGGNGTICISKTATCPVIH
jgi:hypothetical protein